MKGGRGASKRQGESGEHGRGHGEGTPKQGTGAEEAQEGGKSGAKNRRGPGRGGCGQSRKVTGRSRRGR